MKLAILLLFALAARAETVYRFVGSISYDPKACTITYTIQTGDVSLAASLGLAESKIKWGSKSKYTISLHDYTMVKGKVKHQFAEEEAAHVHAQMEQFTRYALQSAQWFDDPKLQEEYWRKLKQRPTAPEGVLSARQEVPNEP